MYENAQIQTVAIEFSRRREQEPCISRTYVSLTFLKYNKNIIEQTTVRSNSVSLVLSCVFEDCRCGDLTNKV